MGDKSFEKVKPYFDFIWKIGFLSLAYWIAEDKNIFWVVFLVAFALYD